MTRLGFVGLGRMGAAMAPRLLGEGRALTVWNRNAARATPLVAAGATLAATPAEVARGAEIVFSMIRDDAAAAEVYEGPQGFLAAPLEGRLFVEMSTLRPATIARLAQQYVAILAAAAQSLPDLGIMANSARLLRQPKSARQRKGRK